MRYRLKNLSIFLIFLVSNSLAAPIISNSEINAYGSTILLIVSTDKSVYRIEEPIRIQGIVEDPYGMPIVGATIAIEVADPLGGTVYLDIKYSQSDGTFESMFSLANGSLYGNYAVFATAYKDGLTAPSQTVFLLQEGLVDIEAPDIQNVNHQPLYPDETETIDFYANVTDNVEVDRVFLNYTVDMGATWNLKSMNIIEYTITYTTSLGPYPSDTILGYNVIANDTANNWAIGWEVYVPAAPAPPYTSMIVSEEGKTPEPPYVPGDDESDVVPIAQDNGCAYIFPDGYLSIYVDVWTLGIWIPSGTYWIEYTLDGGITWTKEPLENVVDNVWNWLKDVTGLSIMYKVESVDPFNNIKTTKIYWIIVGYHTPFFVFASLYPVGHVYEETDQTVTPCDEVSVYFHLKARNLAAPMEETAVEFAPVTDGLIKDFEISDEVFGTVDNDFEITLTNRMTICGGENAVIQQLVDNPGQIAWLTNQIKIVISYRLDSIPKSETINSTPVDLTGQPLFVVYRPMAEDADNDGIPNYLEDFRIFTRSTFDVSFNMFDEILRFEGCIYATNMEKGSSKLNQVLQLLEHGANARPDLADYDTVGLMVVDLSSHPFYQDDSIGFIKTLLLANLIGLPATPIFTEMFRFLTSTDGHMRLAFVIYGDTKNGQNGLDIDYYVAKEDLSNPEGFSFIFTQVTQGRLRTVTKILIGILITLILVKFGIVAATGAIAGAVVIAVADFIVNIGTDIVERVYPDLKPALGYVKYAKALVEGFKAWDPKHIAGTLIDWVWTGFSTVTDPGIQLANATGQLVLGVNYTSSELVNSSTCGLYFGSLDAPCSLMILSKDFGPYNLNIVSPDSDTSYYHMQIDDIVQNRSYSLGGWVTNTSSPSGQILFQENDTQVARLEMLQNVSYLAPPQAQLNIAVSLTDYLGSSVSDADVRVEIFNLTDSLGYDATNLGNGEYHANVTTAPFYGYCFVRIIASKAGLFQTVFVQKLHAVIPGDINVDRIVDIFDAILLAGHFNQTPINPSWNANVDINNDNIVDIFDAILLANHFNQHYP